jgi:ankyrin repeat protein
LDVIRFLVEQGDAAVYAQNKRGETPLHLACYKGLLEVVGYLVEKGSSLVQEDNDGSMPLELLYAEFNPDREVESYQMVVLRC